MGLLKKCVALRQMKMFKRDQMVYVINPLNALVKLISHEQYCQIIGFAIECKHICWLCQKPLFEKRKFTETDV